MSGSVSQNVSHVRVIYGDTDMMGIAYYGNYLRWFEVGRNELIRSKGMTYRELEAKGLVLPVAEAEVKYRKPAVYDDELEIVTAVGETGRVRIEFTYQVWRKEGPSGPRELLATGRTLHACLTRADRKPARLPEDVLEKLR